MIVVAVDGRPLQGDLTGVGKYLLNLLTLVDRNSHDVHFIIYTNRNIENKLDLKSYEIIYDTSLFSKSKPMIWFMLFSHLLINKKQFDFFLAGGTFIPLFLKPSKIIIIAYDLTHILASDTMSMMHNFTHRLFYRRAILKAKRIIAISKGTSHKLLKYYNRSADFVIYPVVSEQYKLIDKNLVNEILDKLNINFPYILSVSTLEPRKNIDKVIDAFLYLKANGRLPQHKLLLVGSSGWKNLKMQEVINNNKDVIIQLGYISDSYLPAIYNGASLFVFPSKYEGFGIPPREALYCGVQAIVSNTEELREATVQSAIYVQPDNIIDLANAIDNAIMFPRHVNNLEKNSEVKNQITEFVEYLNQEEKNRGLQII